MFDPSFTLFITSVQSPGDTHLNTHARATQHVDGEVCCSESVNRRCKRQKGAKMTTPRRPLKKRHPEDKVAKEKAKAFDFAEQDEEKYLSGSEDEVRAGAQQCVG